MSVESSDGQASVMYVGRSWFAMAPEPGAEAESGDGVVHEIAPSVTARLGALTEEALLDPFAPVPRFEPAAAAALGRIPRAMELPLWALAAIGLAALATGVLLSAIAARG